jgi:hypothetical protein
MLSRADVTAAVAGIEAHEAAEAEALDEDRLGRELDDRARAAEAEAIVRALAAADPIGLDGDCKHCGAYGEHTYADEDETVPTGMAPRCPPTCVHARAKAWAEGGR